MSAIRIGRQGRRGLGLAVLVCGLVAGGAAFAADPTTENCGLLVSRDGQTEEIQVAGFNIMTVQGRLSLPEGHGQVVGVICDRDSLIPAIGDERVMTELRQPLYIRSGGRVMLVDVGEGRFRVRMKEGRPTKAELPELQDRINDMQIAANQAAVKKKPK